MRRIAPVLVAIAYTGLAYLFVWGGGAANATTADMAGGIKVTLGEAARRVGNNAVCPPPDCQVAKLEVPASAAGAPRRLTLYTPHRYKSATHDLFVSLPPTPAPAPMRAGLGSAGTVGGQPHPNLAAVSWAPQIANNYANPVDASNVQTITLTRGRWQIVPDATTPPDFTYTISFRD